MAWAVAADHRLGEPARGGLGAELAGSGLRARTGPQAEERLEPAAGRVAPQEDQGQGPSLQGRPRAPQPPLGPGTQPGNVPGLPASGMREPPPRLVTGEADWPGGRPGGGGRTGWGPSSALPRRGNVPVGWLPLPAAVPPGGPEARRALGRTPTRLKQGMVQGTPCTAPAEGDTGQGARDALKCFNFFYDSNNLCHEPNKSADEQFLARAPCALPPLGVALPAAGRGQLWNSDSGAEARIRWEEAPALWGGQEQAQPPPQVARRWDFFLLLSRATDRAATGTLGHGEVTWGHSHPGPCTE